MCSDLSLSADNWTAVSFATTLNQMARQPTCPHISHNTKEIQSVPMATSNADEMGWKYTEKWWDLTKAEWSSLRSELSRSSRYTWIQVCTNTHQGCILPSLQTMIRTTQITSQNICSTCTSFIPSSSVHVNNRTMWSTCEPWWTHTHAHKTQILHHG